MKTLKTLIILSIIFIFSVCAIFNEDYLSSRQAEELRLNTDLQKLYLTNAKPVFSVEFPEGGNLPAGTKIEYFGEIKYQPIKVSPKQYHPVWQILSNAVPFAFGFLTAKEYRLLAEDKLNNDDYSQKGQTITVGNNGIVNVGSGSVDKTKGSYNSDSSTKTSITDSYKMATDNSKTNNSITDNSNHSITLEGNTLDASQTLTQTQTFTGNSVDSNNKENTDNIDSSYNPPTTTNTYPQITTPTTTTK